LKIEVKRKIDVTFDCRLTGDIAFDRPGIERDLLTCREENVPLEERTTNRRNRARSETLP
jgi:hypothetical protein